MATETNEDNKGTIFYHYVRATDMLKQQLKMLKKDYGHQKWTLVGVETVLYVLDLMTDRIDIYGDVMLWLLSSGNQHWKRFGGGAVSACKIKHPGPDLRRDKLAG